MQRFEVIAKNLPIDKWWWPETQNPVGIADSSSSSRVRKFIAISSRQTIILSYGNWRVFSQCFKPRIPTAVAKGIFTHALKAVITWCSFGFGEMTSIKRNVVNFLSISQNQAFFVSMRPWYSVSSFGTFVCWCSPEKAGRLGQSYSKPRIRSGSSMTFWRATWRIVLLESPHLPPTNTIQHPNLRWAVSGSKTIIR